MFLLFPRLASALIFLRAAAYEFDGDGDCLSAMQMPRTLIDAEGGNRPEDAIMAFSHDDVCHAVHLTKSRDYLRSHHLTHTIGALHHARARLEHATGSLESLSSEAVQPKIFDFFLFAFPAEIPVLELRLAEMADSVDGIFIVEADKDFQGNRRELLLRTLIHEEPLRRYADKLFIIEVNIPDLGQDHDNFGGTYNIQMAINDMIYAAANVVGAIPGADVSRDIFIQSDLDEIIGRKALAALKQCNPATESMAWPLMMTDMDYFQDGFRHRQPKPWDLGPILGPVNEVLGSRSRPAALAPHSIYDGSGSSINVVEHLEKPSRSDVSLLGPWAKHSERGVQHPTDVTIRVREASEATAWHMSWSLSDEGAARKLHARAGGVPTWAVGLDDAELVAEVRHRRLASLPLFDEERDKIFDDPRRLPEAVKEDPERFASFLPANIREKLGI